ncbi:hypothetical protein ACFQ3H_11575, partial [Paralysiella testudinis]
RNHSNYSASSVALAGSYGSNSPGQNADNAAFQDTKLGQAFANNAGDGGFNYSPSLPQQTGGNDSSTTRATLSAGNLTIGGKATTVEALGIHSDPASAHRQLAELPDLQAVLTQQKTVAQATATIATAARTFSSDRVKAAAKEKAQAEADYTNRLKTQNDGSYERFMAKDTNGQHTEMLRNDTVYAQADNQAKDWGIGGSNSRALNAATTLITGTLGGQTNLQVAANTLAPYAAASIGSTVGHGENKNETAQAVGHFILGATLAYVNGADPLAGGSATLAAEKTAQYLTQQYNDGKTAIDPNTGEFNPNLLPEPIKAEIRSVTGAIASVVGATGDGGAAFNAQVAGVIGQNAVENNDFLQAISPASAKMLSRTPEHARAMELAGGLRKITVVGVGVAASPYAVATLGPAAIPVGDAALSTGVPGMMLQAATTQAGRVAIKNAAINGSISAASQAIQNDGKVNLGAVAIDSVTGGIASKYNLGGQVLINTAGSATSSFIQGQNPVNDIPGTVAGTVIGYHAGKPITKYFNERLNTFITRPRDVYVPFNPILQDRYSNIPVTSGTIGGGILGEAGKGFINHTIQNKEGK